MVGGDEVCGQQRPCKKRRIHETATTWDDLPTEVIDMVLTALDDFDLVDARCVCRLWRALANGIYRRPLRLAPTRSEYIMEMARRGDLGAVCRAWPESMYSATSASSAQRADEPDPSNHNDNVDGDDDHNHNCDRGGDDPDNVDGRDHAHCWDDDLNPYTVLRLAEESGNGALVQWLCGEQPHLVTGTAVRAIIIDNGGQAAVEWLHMRGHTQRRLFDYGTATATLAGMGRLDALDWLHTQGDALWDASACAAAASGGHLDVVQWLHQHNHPWDARTCVAAAGSGHTDILWWVIAHGCPHVDRDVVVGLIRNGLLDDLVRAVECGCPLSSLAWEEAAAVCRTDILEWLHIQRCQTSDAALHRAASKGCVDTMRWLRAHGAPWHTHIFRHAAYAGHLDALKWAAANGCPSTMVALYEAVCGGHLHVIEWLCDVLGFSPDDDSLVRAAALSKQYHVLVWLRDRGCRYVGNALAVMACNGHLHGLCWAVRAGFAFDARQCHDAVLHGTRNHRATKKWIEAFGISPPVRARCSLLCPTIHAPNPPAGRLLPIVDEALLLLFAMSARAYAKKKRKTARDPVSCVRSNG